MEEEKVIVYSAEGCAPCKRAKKFLDERNIKYDEKNIKEKLEQSNSESGPTIIGVPKICIGDKCITGFKPSEIENIIK